jgi:hypothetical protein
MSDYEQHVGKLVKVAPAGDETLEDLMRRILAEENIEMEQYHEDYAECFRDELYEKYVIFNNTVYKVDAERLEDYDDIMHGVLADNGDIFFTLRFYNGGCGFDEAIEEAIKKAL